MDLLMMGMPARRLEAVRPPEPRLPSRRSRELPGTTGQTRCGPSFAEARSRSLGTVLRGRRLAFVAKPERRTAERALLAFESSSR